MTDEARKWLSDVLKRKKYLANTGPLFDEALDQLGRLLAANERQGEQLALAEKEADRRREEFEIAISRLIVCEADRASLIKHIRDEFVVLSDELKKEIETD